MKKYMVGILLILFLLLSSAGCIVNAQTSTVAPTESSLITTPIITNTSTPAASGSATPTKIISLPKTGMVQYSMAFFVISAGIILFAFVF